MAFQGCQRTWVGDPPCGTQKQLSQKQCCLGNPWHPRMPSLGIILCIHGTAVSFSSFHSKKPLTGKKKFSWFYVSDLTYLLCLFYSHPYPWPLSWEIFFLWSLSLIVRNWSTRDVTDRSMCPLSTCYAMNFGRNLFCVSWTVHQGRKQILSGQMWGQGHRDLCGIRIPHV